MAHRPQKRQRKAKTTAYHDSIPLNEDNDYATIHAREGKLRKIGRNFLTALSEHSSDVVYDSESWSNATSWSLPDNPEYALSPDGADYNDVLEANIMEEKQASSPPTKKGKSRVAKRPHVVWMELHRQTYLDELTRWAGRGDFMEEKSCPDCRARAIQPPGMSEYRCTDCFLPDLTCGTCCIKRHRTHPFHVIEKWTGSRFVKVLLKSLGLKLQLNHASMFCENPIPCHIAMLVLHTNGIHKLYPASQLTVKTCATFELLQHLHKLALTTKASTYDFYRCLEFSTDNTGINRPKSRYRALLRIILQWRHLKMLKWGGRAHDPIGVDGTQPGELAIRCPSCPHPGINLDDGWEHAPDGMKFLYMMFICMDANFRLKNQLVSNYSQDPGLGTGWAYMVERRPYEKYVLSRAKDTDISTCVGFQALAKANTAFSVGLRYTGVNAAICGRSEMILPQGVGNLQKGERYANMDYIFGSVVRIVLVSIVLISYDIACQWFANLFVRMTEHWPQEIRVTRPLQIVPAIPKLHFSMHKETGHEVYSHNYLKGCGHSDGEGPERVWSPHNSLGNSTKTQGPGSRQDVLDDHFGFWNWLKYVGLGLTLLRRYKAAIAERNLQVEGHRGLTESLDKDLVQAWEKMCVEWEDEEFPKSKKKNPYEIEGTSISEAQVRKELAEEEEGRLAAGGISLHNTSPAAFLVLSLELEEMQRQLQYQAKNTSSDPTIRQQGTLTEQRNNFRTRLRAWEQLLPVYLPGLLQYQTDCAKAPVLSNPAFLATNTNDAHATKATDSGSKKADHAEMTTAANVEDGIIWLPSRIAASNRERVCLPGLAEVETRLRTGQCKDSLDNVRHILRIKTRMIQFKNKNFRGQRQGTRSRTVIDRVHNRARRAAQKYRAARRALMDLIGPGEWEETFRVLEDGNIRGYQDPNRLRPRTGRKGVLEDDQLMETSELGTEDGAEISLFNEPHSRRDGTGATRRTLSWIWVKARPTDLDEENDDILRAEWAKSRARATRAKEEVMLLKEEMRRVQAYLGWKSTWWQARVKSREGVGKELAEGLQAYADTQANLQDALATHFRNLWKAPLEDTEQAHASEETAVNEDEEEGDEDSEHEGDGNLCLDDDEEE